MAELYEVLRPIPGPEGMIAAGQTVDVSTWRPRNVGLLVERRYLRPTTAQPSRTAQPARAAKAPASKE